MIYEIFALLLPIILVALCGYLAARSGFIATAECDALAKFVNTLVIPALLFSKVASANIPQGVGLFLLSYYAAALALFALALLASRRLFALRAREQAAFAVASTYSNATVIGIPVCIAGLGEGALLPLVVLVAIHNLVLFSAGIITAERHSVATATLLRDLAGLLGQLLSNPITASLIAGGLVNILHLPLYPPLGEAVDLLARAAVPAALFVLGASINQFHLRQQLRPALVIVVGKILLLPLLVWLLAFKVFAIAPLWAATAVLVAAMPVGINSYIFAQRYRALESTVAAAILVSTLVGIVSLGGWIGYLRGQI